MIYTPEEIQKLYDIVDYRLARIIADVMGNEVLTPEDKEILTKFGYKWKKEVEKLPPYFQSYLFGRLSGQLTPDQLVTLNYEDFRKYINYAQWVALRPIDKEMYFAAATRTYSYIKTMGRRAKDIISNAVSEEEVKVLMEKQRELELKTIKKEIMEGILKKTSRQRIMSNIGHSLNDWNRDWGRIVETEMQGIFQIGCAQQIMQDHGPETLVYKEVFPGACFPIEDTEFLTDEGFKFLDEIRGDEKILTYNLETNTAEYSNIVSKIKYYYKGEMDSYQHKYMDLISTPNHRHLIGKWDSANKCFNNKLIESRQAGKSAFRDVMYLSVANWKGYDKEEIEICGKIFPTLEFSIFMGWFLSEGSMSFRKKQKKSKSSNSSYIRISQMKEENFDEIQNCLEKVFNKKVYRCNTDFVVLLDKTFDKFLEWLNIGDSINRYIPKEILMLDKKYLELMLMAFIKGDGCIKSKISYTFSLYTSSKKLADDLCELVLKCGYAPSIYTRNNIGRVTYKKDGSRIETKHLRYIVGCNSKKTTKNIPKYFKIIPYWEGYVGCLEVEKNNTLFIRRKGKMIWSGNCKHCIKFYTTNGIGSEPRTFKLMDLIMNGDNIGLKVKDWKPTLQGVHPFCRCNLRYVPKGYVWDEETKSYRVPKDYKPQIKRQSKVIIKIGDKTFEV